MLDKMKIVSGGQTGADRAASIGQILTRFSTEVSIKSSAYGKSAMLLAKIALTPSIKTWSQS